MSAPWIKWYTSAFLTSVGADNLKADEIGVYAICLNLMAERGGPIDYDGSWIAGRSGTSTRRCNQILARLIALGRLSVRGNLLGNERMFSEVNRRNERSEQARSAALARWETSPASALSEDKTEIKARLNGDNLDLKAGKKQQEPPITAIVCYANASFPRARAGIESKNITTPTSSLNLEGVGDEVVKDDLDLLALTQAVCDAAGMSGRIASRPALLTSSMDIVKGWMKAGINIMETAVPAIKAELVKMGEPAHSLNRFAPVVDTLAARKRNAQGGSFRPPPKPAVPVFVFEEEDEAIAEFRRAVAQRIGERSYASWCSDIRFIRSDRVKDGDGRVLTMTPAKPEVSFRVTAIIDTNRSVLSKTAAEILGTTMFR